MNDESEEMPELELISDLAPVKDLEKIKTFNLSKSGVVVASVSVKTRKRPIEEYPAQGHSFSKNLNFLFFFKLKSICFL